MKKKIKDLTYEEALKVCKHNQYACGGMKEFHCYECPLYKTIKCIDSAEMKLEKEVEIDE